MNKYKELKERQQAEVNAFPFMFAFSEKQFAEGMRKWGLDPETDKAKISSIGAGGFVRKCDVEKMLEMFNRHTEETKAAIAADQNGDGFIFDMFTYELFNHEYGYTGDISDTLDALNMSIDDINESQALVNGLQKAVEYVNENTY